jgi:hypothetical protein
MSLGLSNFSSSPMEPEPYRLMWDEHGALCSCGCGRQTWREWRDGQQYVPYYSRACAETRIDQRREEKE